MKSQYNSYAIGHVPTFDPCDECLLKTVCEEQCKDKFLYDKNNKTPKPIKIKITKKRKRKSKT